jgi:hypothetical protein
MVTPLSAAGATARALAPLEGVADIADVTEDLLVLTDFPDCFSRLLVFTVCFETICFDATAGFFVAGAGLTATGFAGAVFAAGLTTLPAGLFATLLTAFLTAVIGRFAFATGFGGALCVFAATGLVRADAFAFLA